MPERVRVKAGMAILLAASVWTGTVAANEVRVSTDEQLRAAIAAAGPGSEILIAPGDTEAASHDQAYMARQPNRW